MVINPAAGISQAPAASTRPMVINPAAGISQAPAASTRPVAAGHNLLISGPQLTGVFLRADKAQTPSETRVDIRPRTKTTPAAVSLITYDPKPLAVGEPAQIKRSAANYEQPDKASLGELGYYILGKLENYGQAKAPSAKVIKQDLALQGA